MSPGYGWTKREKIPWNKISSTGPAPVKPGVYLAEITEATPRETKGKEPKPGMQIILELFEDSDGEALPRRKRVYDNATFSEDAGFRVKQLCEALDLEPPEYNGYEDVKDFGEELVGQKIWCKVKVQTYEGNTNNKIDRYFAEEEVDEVLAEMEGDGAKQQEEDEKPRRRSKKRSSKSANGAEDNGSPRKRRRGAAAADTEDMTDEGSDDFEEEEKASPHKASKRRRSRANANA